MVIEILNLKFSYFMKIYMIFEVCEKSSKRKIYILSNIKIYIFISFYNLHTIYTLFTHYLQIILIVANNI